MSLFEHEGNPPQPCFFCGDPTDNKILGSRGLVRKDVAGSPKVIEAEKWIRACTRCARRVVRAPDPEDERKARADYGAAYKALQERLF